MDTEVCPFCGKPFKRLKRHLPHCKAAGGSTTPSDQQDVSVSQKTSSVAPPFSQQAPALSGKTTKSKKPNQTPTSNTQTKKSNKVFAASSASQRSSEQASSISLPPPSSLKSGIDSSSSSTNNNKQKLADKIRMATAPSNISLPHSPSLSPSKPKKYLRDQIEAAGCSLPPQAPLEGNKANSVDYHSVSTTISLVSDLKSQTSSPKKCQTNPVEDDTHFATMPTDTKIQASTKTSPQKEWFNPSLSSTKGDGIESGAAPNKLDKCWEAVKGIRDNQSEKEMLWQTRSNHWVRITPQDVKATLGQSNSSHRLRKLEAVDLDHSETTASVQILDSLHSKNKSSIPLVSRHQMAGPLDQNEHAISPLLKSVALLVTTGSQASEPLSILTIETSGTTNFKDRAVIPCQAEGSPQPKPIHLLSSLSPPLPAYLTSTAYMMEGLNVDCHKMRLSHSNIQGGTLSRSCISYTALQPCTLFPRIPTMKVETSGVNEGFMTEKPHLQITKNGIRGALSERSLGHVTLRELPEWLSIKTPSHPREVVEMIERGWQWYYRRYIDVRKGGVGGVGMLLAGYCVLSYIWSYPHLKRDRWRKFH